MHIIHVYVHVIQEHITDFIATTKDNAANSRREPGVVRFDLLRQQDEPARFMLVEVYKDLEASMEHKRTAHYERWRMAVEPMMAEPRHSLRLTNVDPSDGDW